MRCWACWRSAAGNPRLCTASPERTPRNWRPGSPATGIRRWPITRAWTPNTRRLTQERFIDGEVPIVAATIAFGMGIDKPDIRLVVHYTLPKSIEGYYQETGRAGRDGLPSDCVLFFNEGDRAKQEYFIQSMTGDARAVAEKQLQQMVDYCRLTTCRRWYLLQYFGDTVDESSCGACDVCLAQRQAVDVTVVAQKLLSAVIRTGERFGIAHVSDVLLGSGKQRIKELGHDKLSVYGIVNDYDRSGLRDIANGLVERGLLAREDGQYPTVSVTNAGREWLRNRETLTLDMRIDEPSPQSRLSRARRSNGGGAAAPNTGYDDALFEQLRTLRRRLADEEGVPAFVVFGDATLKGLAAAKPTNPQDMLAVSGVGPAKLERYGEAFLAVIREYAKSAPHGSEETKSIATSDSLFKNQIKAVLHMLDEREALILRLRYGLDDSPPRTLAEIGRRLGLSRERIRQIEARALNKVERRSQSAEVGQSKSYSVDEIRREHPRAYESWNAVEDQQLMQLYQEGLYITELSARLGRGPGAIQSRLARLGQDTDSQPLGETHNLTHQLLQQGLTVAEIAASRKLSQGTVMAHIERIINAGEAVDLTPLLPARERRERIEAALHAAGHDRLAPAKELLGDDYSYDEIRLVRLANGGAKT